MMRHSGRGISFALACVLTSVAQPASAFAQDEELEEPQAAFSTVKNQTGCSLLLKNDSKFEEMQEVIVYNGKGQMANATVKSTNPNGTAILVLEQKFCKLSFVGGRVVADEPRDSTGDFEAKVDSSFKFQDLLLSAAVLIGYPCMVIRGALGGAKRDFFEELNMSFAVTTTCVGTSAVSTTLWGAYLADQRTEAIQFIAFNRNSLMSEIARRRGDSMLALFDVLKVKHHHREIFSRILAENHSYIFSADYPSATFERILAVLNRVSES